MAVSSYAKRKNAVPLQNISRRLENSVNSFCFCLFSGMIPTTNVNSRRETLSKIKLWDNFMEHILIE
jgi:hypothetical protein